MITTVAQPVSAHSSRKKTGKKYPASLGLGQDEWEQRIDEHLLLVRRLARRVAERIQRLDLMDDLLQAGFYGLVEASRRFDSRAGKPFQAYARLRIQGAIVDEIRRQDWRPRRISRSAGRIARQMAILEQKLGRAASEQEVAAGLGLSVREYQQELEQIECGHLEGLVDEPEDVNDWREVHGGEWKAMHQELGGLLAEAVEQLPVQERQLLGFFYKQGMNQCEIALIFNLTEARISQLHKQALLRLRAWLQRKHQDVSGTGFDLTE